MIDPEEEEEEDLSPQEAVGLAIYSWRLYTQRGGQRVTPPMVGDTWLRGLKAAGIDAEHPPRFAGGRYSDKLQMAVEFTCPYWHRGDNRGTFAKVRWIVEDDAWVTIAPESACPHCTDEALQRWFLTCPRCEAGEDSWDHQPNHGPGGTGDASPFAFVLASFRRLAMRSEASWWVNHTDEARAEYLKHLESRMGLADDRMARRLADIQVTRAHQVLNVTTVQITRRVAWTDQSTAEWLDVQTGAGGDLLVPVEATQRDAWGAVKSLAGRPPKNRVEAAQTLRKGRT